MNIPNKLTILRVCLIPVFVIVYKINAIPNNEMIAAFIFIFASITDFFDGYLARKYKLITNFGKFLDPLADKLLVNTALICFLTIQNNPVPFWVVLVIIARDFIINGFRLIASDNGVVIAADYWGKAKTATQMIMIIYVILDFDFMYSDVIGYVFIYLSAILTVISLFDCIIKNLTVIMDDPSSKLMSLKEEKIIDLLRSKKMTISFAESCTGGMLCSSLINVSGSSEVIKQSAVTYCNEAKINLLGVSKATIDTCNVVSYETAKEMAEGAAKWAESDIAVSITGIAGPEGGTQERPVGLVYIGLYSADKCISNKYIFKGKRNEVRTQAVDKALDMIIEAIN